MSTTSKKWLACQNKTVLGIFDSEEEARQEVLDEIERDKFWLVLKRSLLKTLLKRHGKLRFNGGMYYVAFVTEVIEE